MVLDPDEEIVEETTDMAFCSECDAECDAEEGGEPPDYDTNSGGYYMESSCCGAQVFKTRFRNPLTEEWQYPEASRIEWEPSEPCYGDD